MSIFKKITAFPELIRWKNSVMTFLVVSASGFAAGSAEFNMIKLVYPALSAFFIACSANAINDVFDVKIDLINRPGRPIPSGRVSKKSALFAGLILATLGILTAFFKINAFHGIFAFAVAVILWAYTPFFKGVNILGNFAVSSACGASFVYGGSAITAPQNLIHFALIGFFITLGREILKDLEDIRGDIKEGLRTFAIAAGEKKSFTIIRFSVLIFLILVFLPVFPSAGRFSHVMLLHYGKGYFWASFVLVLPLTALFFYKSRKRDNYSANDYRDMSRLLKQIMAAGLLAIILSGF